jgi:hypothetical protein
MSKTHTAWQAVDGPSLKQSKTVKEFVQHHNFKHIKQHSIG